MARIARLALPGAAHYIRHTARGGCLLFIDQADYGLYLSLLQQYTGPAGVKVLVCALLPREIHAVVVPRAAESLCNALKPVNLLFARRMNVRRKRHGPLWSRLPSCCAVQDKYVACVVQYIERLPAVARLAGPADAFSWSTASHLTIILSDNRRRDLLLQAASAVYFDQVTDSPEYHHLRVKVERSLHSGQPPGDDTFRDEVRRFAARARLLHAAGRREARL